jgi:hypothetical protein
LFQPNGVFKTTNEQHLIDVTPDSSQIIKHIEIVHPDDMVENSRFTKIIITGQCINVMLIFLTPITLFIQSGVHTHVIILLLLSMFTLIGINGLK